MRDAASPMRISPDAIIVCAASAPPDGLMAVASSSRPSASISRCSEVVKGPYSSARSTLSSATPARCAASRADIDDVRSRTPRVWASLRWSMPLIHAGRSHSSRARSPAASTTAQPPSASAGRSEGRNGSTARSSARISSTDLGSARTACGLEAALDRLRAAISARRRSLTCPPSSIKRAARASTA